MVSSTLMCPVCQVEFPMQQVPAAQGETPCPKCGATVPPPSLNFSFHFEIPEKSTAISITPEASQVDPAPHAETLAGRHDLRPSHEFPFLAPPKQPDELGWLGEYRILGLLGMGGMGVVFRAEDPHLNRQLAIKAMQPAANTSTADVARFLREARAQAAVDHDHVAAIFQVGEDRGVPFIAMPLLKGQPLSSALRANSRVPIAEAVRIAREMLEGLAAAHEQGLIHRDIKPGNIWLEGARRRVKILDFGLARPTTENSAISGDSTPMTQSGFVVGTPAYMSPEQALGDPLDGRSDVFSVGTVLYLMLTGQEPFRAATVTKLLFAVASANPATPRSLNPQVPPELDAFTMQLLAKNPDARPATASEAAKQLKMIEAGLAVAGVVATPVDPVPGAAPAVWDAIDSNAVTSEVSGERTARTPSSSANQTAKSAVHDSPRKPKSRLLIGAMLAFFVVCIGLTADIIIKIRNKDGTETEIKAPDGSTVTVTKDGKEVAKVGPDPKKDPVKLPDERALAEWGIKLGGKVSINNRPDEISDVKNLPKEPLILSGLHLSELRHLKNEDLSRFAGCKNITILWLGQTAIGDAGLANFKDCGKLIKVVLDDSEVTNAGMVHLKGAKNLRELFLNHTKVGDDGMAQLLSECKELREVWMDDAPITDSGLLLFRDCKNLHTLNVNQATEKGAETLSKFLPACKIRLAGGVVYKPKPLDDRSAAERMIAVGGKVWVNDATNNMKPITAVADLPKEEFKLNGIDMYDTAVTDADLSYLKQSKNLTYLGLTGAKIGDKGLANFKGSTKLTRLHISRTQATDEGLANFKDCKALHDLFVGQTKVSDVGLEHFKNHKDFLYIQLDGTQITNAGLAYLKGSKNIAWLDVSDTRVTDAGLEPFKNLERLQDLRLRSTKVTDTGLGYFQACKNLKLVDVRKTGVTAARAKEFAEELPMCSIYSDSGTFSPKK